MTVTIKGKNHGIQREAAKNTAATRHSSFTVFSVPVPMALTYA